MNRVVCGVESVAGKAVNEMHKIGLVFTNPSHQCTQHHCIDGWTGGWLWVCMGRLRSNENPTYNPIGILVSPHPHHVPVYDVLTVEIDFFLPVETVIHNAHRGRVHPQRHALSDSVTRGSR